MVAGIRDVTDYGRIVERKVSSGEIVLWARLPGPAGPPASPARMTMPEIDRHGNSSAKEVAQGYLGDFIRLLQEVDVDALDRVVGRLRVARDGGATIFLAGNGGSSATASHWANDLGKATKPAGRGAIQVMCMSDNTPWLTALANDEGYERVFAGQLENFAKPGDVLIVLSASGNSRNLVQAVELANERRLVTIGFLGFDGGALKHLVRELVWLDTPKGEYGLVESAHAVLCDIVTTCLIEDRAERPDGAATGLGIVAPQAAVRGAGQA
jgi:D-sedoheptulose 7-phosphate isomerase